MKCEGQCPLTLTGWEWVGHCSMAHPLSWGLARLPLGCIHSIFCPFTYSNGMSYSNLFLSTCDIVTLRTLISLWILPSLNQTVHNDIIKSLCVCHLRICVQPWIRSTSSAGNICYPANIKSDKIILSLEISVDITHHYPVLPLNTLSLHLLPSWMSQIHTWSYN